MAVTTKTRTMIWGRAGGRCSFPECRRELVLDATLTDDESLIGEIAHIVAEEPGGPRGESPILIEQRNKYANLILLCNVDHKRIDDQTSTYTVEKLQVMKAEHEAWVRSSLHLDPKLQQIQETYAGIIEEWSKMVNLETWDQWLGGVFFADQPRISISALEALDSTRIWIFRRIWPKRHVELEVALQNFGDVCGDLVDKFHEHSIEREKRLFVERFYRLQWHTEERYQQLVNDFKFHNSLLRDLALELTRAANYVCDKAREFIDPVYRLQEGALIIKDDDYVRRPEYLGAERTPHPYPGLNRFLLGRESRDTCFGHGEKPREAKKQEPPLE